MNFNGIIYAPMPTRKYVFPLLALIAIQAIAPRTYARVENPLIWRVLEEEMARSVAGLKLDTIPGPYFLGFRVDETRTLRVSATLGALLIVLIRQSIRTMHFDQNYEWIIIGCATVLAVVLDQASARFAVRQLAARSR